MSQTMQPPSAQQQADYDSMTQYLSAATMPQNDFKIDPQFHSIQNFLTPIGRFPYIRVAAPNVIRQPDGSPGKPMFSASLLMAPGTEQHPIVLDLYRAVCMVADTHWPSIPRVDPQTNATVSVTGSQMFGVDKNLGGFHYPLRLGNDNYMKDPAKFWSWRGLYFINCGMPPKTKNGVDRRPICLDEMGNETDPARFYPGCYGRMMVDVVPFENMGNKGVTFFLRAMQFAKMGERMSAGFDAVAAAKQRFTAAGALPVAEPMQPQGGGFPAGFGPNSVTPASVPAGASMPGFAQPPQAAPYPQQAQPGFTPQPGQPIPPQQPWTPASPQGGARPPGV